MNLETFYTLMFQTKNIRSRLAQQIIKNQSPDTKSISELDDILSKLLSLPISEDNYFQRIININNIKTVPIDLTYEINELRKDLFFLKHSNKKDFWHYLISLNQISAKEFEKQLDKGKYFLSTLKFKTFITDRDGTINNYCARYISSIQSIYNAVFLYNFTANRTQNSVILTSAPLENVGLIDISLIPAGDGNIIYAGSKGREYRSNIHTEKRTFPIPPKKQYMLNKLNTAIKQLLTQESYRIFTMIGSGLQFKFGQTTIARQDINNSIDKQTSIAFLHKIEDLVSNLDPDKRYFRIEDTGKDIEIILTIEKEGHSNNDLKDFDKGDGVSFINNDLPLKMHEGLTLVCGDTASDIPMMLAAKKSSKDIRVIFISNDHQLSLKLKDIFQNNELLILSSPDILILLLYIIAGQG